MKRRSSNESQRGAMLVMMVPIMGLFLTLAAFAIDMGNMYLWKMRVDKAARAGVVAGLGYRGLAGWSAVSQDQTGLTNVVRNVIRSNFNAYGESNPGTITVNYTPATDSISAAINYQVKTILAGRLAGVFGFSLGGSSGNFTIQVSSTQNAQLNQAYVAMLLDVSGSMLCPADARDDTNITDNDPCTCRRYGNCPSLAKNKKPNKLDALSAAVQTFRGFFNPNRDLITVIPFNTAAKVTFPLVPTNINEGFGRTVGTTTFDTQIASSTLTGLTGSNTNPCDALAEAIGQFSNLGGSVLFTGQPSTNIRPFVVMFSDGAPNAFRGIFTGTALDGGAAVDLYHYALEWSQTVTDANNVPQTYTYRGPSQFVKRSVNVNGDPNLFKFSPSGSTLTPTGSTSCSSTPAQSDPSQFVLPIQSCLFPSGNYDARNSTYQFTIPNTSGATAVVGSVPAVVGGVPVESTNSSFKDLQWPRNNGGQITPARLNYFDQLPYYCAIEAADYIRQTFGGTIFAIGLGPAAPATRQDSNFPAPGDNCDDPLQNSDDHYSRKDFFLTRLAFSRQMFTDQTDPSQSSTDPHYRFNLFAPRNAVVPSCSDHRYTTALGSSSGPAVGYIGGASGASDDNSGFYDAQRPVDTQDPYNRRIDTQGEYYPTNQAPDLSPIFSTIAKSILLKLTS